MNISSTANLKPLKNYDKLLGLLNSEPRNNQTVYEAFSSQKELRDKSISLRVDVDNGLICALRFAEDLNKIGFKASFYFLTSTAPYRIDNSIIKEIHDLGHEVGLHSDHYYMQLSQNLDGVSEIKRDVALLSELIGEPIKGLCFHGHQAIDDIKFQGNWYLYREMPPQELNLEYHDGVYGDYCNRPVGKMWLPPTELYLSDYPYAWRNSYTRLDEFFRKIGKQAGHAHVVIHPSNFFEVDSWKVNPADEAVVPLRSLPKKTIKIKILMFIKRVIRYILKLSQRFLKLLLNTIRQLIGSKKHHGILSSLGGSHSISDFIDLINDKEQSNYSKIFESFGIRSDHKVIDIGFGAGQFLFMASAVAEQVTGVEPNDELFQYVKDELEKRRLGNVELIQTSGANIPLETESIDRALILSVLMLVSPQDMMMEVSRLLKKRGQVVLHLSDIGYALNCIRDGVYCDDKSRIDVGLNLLFARFVRLLIRDYNVGGVFTRSDISKLANRTGFKVIRSESAPYFKWEPDKFFGFKRQFLVVLEKIES